MLNWEEWVFDLQVQGKAFLVLMLIHNYVTSSIYVPSFSINVLKQCVDVIVHAVYEQISSHMAEINQQLLGDVQAFCRD